MHESGRLWDPPKHENGARKGRSSNVYRIAGAQGAEQSGECHQKKKHQGQKDIILTGVIKRNHMSEALE